MKKLYQKPDVNYISLIAQEEISNDDSPDIVDGEMTMESSIF